MSGIVVDDLQSSTQLIDLPGHHLKSLHIGYTALLECQIIDDIAYVAFDGGFEHGGVDLDPVL